MKAGIKGRVLCADDDKDTCEMVTTMLGQAGYEVRQALSVREGLRLAKKGGFDLILLDWIFQDGTGIELCEMIRSFDSKTAILFYSGIAYEAEIKKALRTGAQGFIVKPLGTETLVQTVTGFVNNDPSQGSHAP